jgi:uncharacterized protein YcbK (DUF882 family)
MSSLLTPTQSRRQFLNTMVTGLFAASVVGAAKKMAVAATPPFVDVPVTMPPLPTSVVSQGGEVRDLHLYNPNTQEETNLVFYANGSYNPQALQQINLFLRDYHQNVPHTMDPALLTLIHDMQKVFDMRQIHVISAYRTKATNDQLVRSHVTSAKDSFHCKGQAIDIRIPGVPTNAMRDVAKILSVGGVGYYPHAHFVHVDTGPVRYW